MKTALVHDWLFQNGGAEDVLETLQQLFPGSPIYTSLYRRDKMPARWQGWDVRTSFIDRLPFAHRLPPLYLPAYPMAFEHFDLSDYPLVISNKSAFCHGVITGPETLHISYCLTPTRFLWRYRQYADQERLGPVTRKFLVPFLTYLRMWDRLAADRVDHFVAISQEVRRRIAKIYRRDAVIIYPPVDTERFEPAAHSEDYYLMVGRLLPYRRIDLLIEAFNKMQKPLVIVGQGRDRARLEALAGPTVTFLGYVPDADLPDLMARSRAFVWPGEEDFGIAPIQAMATGRPVIAYGAGGALDTVIPGTGHLFAEQSVAAIIDAVQGFNVDEVDSRHIRAHAEKFDSAVFKQKMMTFVEQKLSSHLLTRNGQPEVA